MQLEKCNNIILCIVVLLFINSSCENKNKISSSNNKNLMYKDNFISPMKKEVLSESKFKEVDNMLSTWSHVEWETPPEVDFLQKINQPTTVKGIVSLWTHSIPVENKDFSLILDSFYKIAQPLSIDGEIMTNKNESKAFINIKDGVFLVYKNKNKGGVVSAVFYRNRE